MVHINDLPPGVLRDIFKLCCRRYFVKDKDLHPYNWKPTHVPDCRISDLDPTMFRLGLVCVLWCELAATLMLVANITSALQAMSTKEQIENILKLDKRFKASNRALRFETR